MSPEKREQFLADLHVGVIAVERPERAPLAVPIWYFYEPGGEVLLWTDANSVKHHVIRAAGRFTITVQDERPPYRYVTAEGDVTGITPATEDDVRKLAARYGEPDVDGYVKQMFTSTSIAIRMRPQRWLSADYS